MVAAAEVADADADAVDTAETSKNTSTVRLTVFVVITEENATIPLREIRLMQPSKIVWVATTPMSAAHDGVG